MLNLVSGIRIFNTEDKVMMVVVAQRGHTIRELYCPPHSYTYADLMVYGRISIKTKPRRRVKSRSWYNNTLVLEYRPHVSKPRKRTPEPDEDYYREWDD